jgi:hypothetical protein
MPVANSLLGMISSRYLPQRVVQRTVVASARCCRSRVANTRATAPASLLIPEPLHIGAGIPSMLFDGRPLEGQLLPEALRRHSRTTYPGR